MRKRRSKAVGETALFSPLLDVLMNALGAILMLLLIYVYFARGSGPPVLILSEENLVFRFESGSAEISPEFSRAFVADVLPRLEGLAESYGCDVIEIVGHTDGQPLQVGLSNLDEDLLAAYSSGNIATLTPGSNVDLGVMRAISVMGMLKDLQKKNRLKGIRLFLPYSSGQCILPGQQPARADDRGADPTRRRIEIRLLRSDSWRFESATQKLSPKGV